MPNKGSTYASIEVYHLDNHIFHASVIYGLRRQSNIAVRGKYGKDKSRDLLYWRTCGNCFDSTQASALFGLHLPAETIRQIIHHVRAEGVGVRATARLLELDKDTVNRVILRVGEHYANVLSSLMISLKLTEVQLDYLWAFEKKESSGNTEDLERQYGRTWIWAAIDAPTRLLITFWIGGRGLDDAWQMLKGLTARSQGKPLFVSDNCPITARSWVSCFTNWPRQHSWLPWNPAHATVHKTRQGAQVIKVERKVIRGSE